MRVALLILLIILVVIQFIPSGFQNNSYDAEDDFFEHYLAPAEVKTMIRNSCYDCHSQETVNPWYNKVAPVKFWITNHIESGRGKLDFNNWGTYTKKQQDHKIQECIDIIGKGWMPLGSYEMMHKEARLSDEDRKQMIEFFERLD